MHSYAYSSALALVIAEHLMSSNERNGRDYIFHKRFFSGTSRFSIAWPLLWNQAPGTASSKGESMASETKKEPWDHCHCSCWCLHSSIHELKLSKVLMGTSSIEGRSIAKKEIEKGRQPLYKTAHIAQWQYSRQSPRIRIAKSSLSRVHVTGPCFYFS